MRIFLWLLTPAVEVWLLMYYNLPLLYYFFVFLTIIEIIFVDHRKIRPSLAGWWLYLYLFCSFIVIASIKFTPSKFSLGIKYITDNSFIKLSEISIIVMFCYFFALLIFYRKNSIVKESNWTNYTLKFNYKITFTIAFILSVISLMLGIGKMGQENVRLPFHLTGIIQFCRTDLIPVIVLCIYADLKKNKKKVGKILLLLFVWALFESVVRMSKSAIIFSFMPIIFYEIISRKKNLWKTIKPLMPVFIVIFLLYPIIGSLRNDTSDDVEIDLSGTFSNPESSNIIVQPFNRTFVTGVLLCIDINYIGNENIFNFKNAIPIILLGGSARYQTYVIDGYGEDVHHSSGTSPFVDSFLMGGYGLLFISVILMVFFAHLIDKGLNKKANFIIMSIMCVAFFRIFEMPLFTFFLNEMCVRYLIVYTGVCVMIIYNWKKNKRRILN